MTRIKHNEFAGSDAGGLRAFYAGFFDGKSSRRDAAGFDYCDVAAGA